MPGWTLRPNRYRKAVEEIANSGQGDELAVARAAVSLARDAVDQLTSPILVSQNYQSQRVIKLWNISQSAGMDSARSLARILVTIFWVRAARRWNRLQDTL